MIYLNRKDREITDRQEIISLLGRCDTVRLGLFDGEQPYVVPVSFGLDTAGEDPVIYFHCAKRGMKVDCIRHSQKVCIEADIFYKVEPTERGITARYESVIGFGSISEVEGEEKVYGLTRLLEHYGRFDYPVDKCRGLDGTAVYKIVLHSLTGKRNLPAD